MPLRVLNQSGVHRAACFALHRALLRQACTDAPELKQVVSLRFRKNAPLQGHPEVTAALEIGYATLKALRNADAPHTVKSLTDGLTSIFQPEARASSDNQERKRDGPRVWPYPGAASVFSRPKPLAALSGRRHVPRLISASGVPFLKFKKKQPRYLSRIIRAHLTVKQKRYDRIGEFEYLEDIAKLEDAWDATVEGRLKTDSDDKDVTNASSWTTEVASAVDGQNQLLKRQGMQHQTMAKRMFEIVKQERELKEAEKQMRREQWELAQVEVKAES